MLSIQDLSQRERAAIGALQLLPRELRAELRKAGRDQVVPMAIKAATAAAGDATMRTIVSRARFSAWKDIPGVAFGGRQPVTSDGVPGRTLVRGLEFGSKGRWVQLFQQRSPRGRLYDVVRRTTRQFLPDRSSNPTTVYPAMERIADDVVQLWVDLVEQQTIRALDEGS